MFFIGAVMVAAIIMFVSSRFMGGAVEVKTAPVKRQPLALTVTGTSTGTIKADDEIKITAQRIGRISRLNVIEGDVVTAAQGIAVLDDAETSLGVQQARAALIRVRAVRDQMASALEAQRVDVSTSVDKADALVMEAETRYKGMKELFDKGYVSRMDYSMAEKEYQVAIAERARARSGSKQLKAREDEIRAQDAAEHEARIAVDRAALDQEYSYIAAPVAGVITSVPVKVGETLMKGALVAQMIRPESQYISALIDEADVDRVRVAQTVNVTMDAYPGKVYKGVVTKLSPVVLGAKLETRTFEARVVLEDKAVLLKNGMSADVDIVVSSVNDALVVPSQAVTVRGNRKYVYVKDDGRARLREVTLGVSDWTNTQIVNGVSEHDVVLTTPDAKELKDGSRIVVAK